MEGERGREVRTEEEERKRLAFTTKSAFPIAMADKRGKQGNSITTVLHGLKNVIVVSIQEFLSTWETSAVLGEGNQDIQLDYGLLLQGTQR